MNDRRPLARWARLFLLSAVLLFDPTAAATVPSPFDRDGDGEVGEATAIRERARLYHRRHGVDGVLSAEEMGRRARWTSTRWLEKRRTASSDEPGWINLGPINGAGRCAAVAPHPEIDGTVLAGAAGGGVWRTVDGGASWVALTDGIADLSVGAVAYAPSDTDVIYLGTGEGGYAGDFIPGIGLLRSVDGGENWFLPDGEIASQFFALSVHPLDAMSLLAATNEGLFHSADGGVSWEERVPGNLLVGVSEVLRSASDPDLVYAAMWCATTCPDGIARVMRSADGGVSWEAADSGLPAESFNQPSRNRLALAMAASDDRVLWVGAYTDDTVTDGRDVSIFSSRDGGSSWIEAADPGPYLGVQGWYDNTIVVHPENHDVVIAGGMYYVVSHDGGQSWIEIDPYADDGDGMGTDTVPHVDGQDLQWQGDTLWLACDGGMWTSEDNGLTWSARNDYLVTRQYYGMAIDPMRREKILAGTQDNASNLRRTDGDDRWDVVIHSDGFECAINPLIPDLMYGTIYNTHVYRNYEGGAGEWQKISPNLGGERAPFYTPLTMRDEAPWVLYTGATSVYRTTDAGDHWSRLSTVVENGVWSNGVVLAVAVTPADPELLMVAKENQIFISRDGGQIWTVRSFDTQVNNIGISEIDPQKAIACLAQTRTRTDQVLLSSDSGATWLPSGSGLPPFAAQVARWHPLEPDTAFVGTDVGLYRSLDGGSTWSEVGSGLPAASVHDMRITPDGARVVVATHGRGVWELAGADTGNTSPTVEILSPQSGVSVVLNQSVDFSAVADDADGDEVALTWIFTDRWQLSDGGSGSGPLGSTHSYSFDSGGRYLVAAHVADERGASAVHSIEVQAYEPADECSTPRVVPGGGPFPVTIVSENGSATEAVTDPDVPCVQVADDPLAGGHGSLWFEFTPELSATYVISTCGSWADTALSAWTGPRCGPYVAVDDGCNDDDEFEYCTGARTDSRVVLDLEAGAVYRFTVGSWSPAWQGPLRFNVECLDCPAVSPERLYAIPAAARTEGSNQTFWSTDLDVHNPGQTAVTARVSFRAGDGGSDAGDAVELTIAPGTSSVHTDVVGDLLGASGAGAIHVLANNELVMTSRTYNTAPEGTFGQGIPGAAESVAVAAGGAARLVGLAGNHDFRTNIGLANATDLPAAVTIALHAADGSALGEHNVNLQPFAWRQLNRVFETAEAGAVDSAFAVVRNTSLSGRVFAYASVVDEHTGDPVYVTNTEVAKADTALWVPAAAHVAGVGESLWRTDLVLANIGASDLTATIEFFPSRKDNHQRPSVIERVHAGTARTVADVIGSRFQSLGTGAIRVTVNRGHLLVGSRTYTVLDSGTFGQSIPGLSEAHAIADGESGLLLQLRQDSSFRTNVGLVNLTGLYTKVSIEFFTALGDAIGTRELTLLPFSHRQINRAVPGGGTDAGFAVVRPSAAGGRVLAYASVVDNGTDDPVYVAAARQ